MNIFKTFILITLTLLPLLTVEAAPKRPSYVSKNIWKEITPYLIPENHPVKKKLDKLFLKKRVLRNNETLKEAGFINRFPRAHSRAIVISHKDIPGYIFKIYLDSKKEYFHGEPEYISWMDRAKGARIVQEEIIKQGWGEMFKVPRKWIYPLPEKPKASKGDLQKNFILVEDAMDTLPSHEILKKWKDGTITTLHLNRLFHIMHVTGLRGGAKYDNIPICRDGRIAFVDTQNYLKWPLPYYRLLQVLNGALYTHWETLMKNATDSETTLE